MTAQDIERWLQDNGYTNEWHYKKIHDTQTDITTIDILLQFFEEVCQFSNKEQQN